MTDHHMDDPAGSLAPVLRPGLLAEIQQLNEDYLELLAVEYATPGCAGQLQYLPRRLHSALGALSPAVREVLAALPLTLYSLGFEDEAFWRAVCDPAKSPAAIPFEQRYAPALSSPQGSFCGIALVHAWHVATSNPMASRVVYAMPDDTAHRLAAVPLWRLRQIAAEHPGLLLPRWPTNPGFWPDLIRFASLQDTRRLATAKLLGSQLIASELESAAAQRQTVRAAQRLPGSPRLRARTLRFEVHLR